MIDILTDLKDQFWRLNNLYRIQDKQGRDVPFLMNESQVRLYKDMWWLNVILKDRQRGFSTFVAIFMLDSCLFTPFTQCGIIDLTLDDAKKKLGKLKFGWETMAPQLRDRFPLTTDAKETLEWANKSRVDVSTSHRGGTLQILHVSEFGKIAARKPDVAKEIKTGAFNTVATGCFQFVESTGEGQEGEFFDICKRSEDLAKQKARLTPLDFKFHFFAWWMGNENELPPDFVSVPQHVTEYLDKLEGEIGRKLSPSKRAWYAKKSEQQGDLMKREFPSTPKEAFEAAIDGAYWSTAMSRMRLEGRITRVPYDSGFPVDTLWDLGMDDSMTIWFRQRVGMQNRIIDYYEHSGEGLDHYARVLNEKGYLYGTHYWPHDGEVRELGLSGGMTRKEKAEELRIKPITIVSRPRDIEAVLNQIEQARHLLATCWIDEAKCAQGIKCLDGYKREWDEKLGSFKRSPLHNWASHGASAFRTGAIALKSDTEMIPVKHEPTWRERLLRMNRPSGAMAA